MSIKLYEVEAEYVDYLSDYAPHLFHNKGDDQKHSRKYIGVLLTVDDMSYFAPLSSFKAKHHKMKNNVDFIKVGTYAVINLNNMFPVPEGLYQYIDFGKEKDANYRNLLMAEYRIIKGLQDKIMKNAHVVYKHRKDNGDSTPLGRRCNDFTALEDACVKYKK